MILPVATLRVEATSPNGEIASVKIYIDNILLKTITEAPFEATYKPTSKKVYQVTAVATDTEGYDSNVATYALRANNKRSTFKGVIALPGIF